METDRKKDFDAVKWSRKAKRRIAELLEGATKEELVAYFNESKLSRRMKRRLLKKK